MNEGYREKLLQSKNNFFVVFAAMFKLYLKKALKTDYNIKVPLPRALEDSEEVLIGKRLKFKNYYRVFSVPKIYQ